MRTVFEIPIDIYHLCLTRFGMRAKEYAILQNGIIARDDLGSEFVQILCDEESARLVREKFAEVCPDLASQIKQCSENIRD